MLLGEKIQLARKKKGMSQEDLANMLNVSRQAVQKWESGANQPEINKLVQISNMFDVSLDYLLKDYDENLLTESSADNNYGYRTIIERPSSEKIVFTEKRLKRSKYKSIRFWLILGCVLSPVGFYSGFYSLMKYYSLLFLLVYAISIPICCYVLNSLKHSNNKNDLNVVGIISIFFVSVIGGIFILFIDDEDFESINIDGEVVRKVYENSSVSNSCITDGNELKEKEYEKTNDDENKGYSAFNDEDVIIEEETEIDPKSWGKYATDCIELINTNKKILKEENEITYADYKRIRDSLLLLEKEARIIDDYSSFYKFKTKLDELMSLVNSVKKKRIIRYIIYVSITILLISAMVVLSIFFW